MPSLYDFLAQLVTGGATPEEPPSGGLSEALAPTPGSGLRAQLQVDDPNAPGNALLKLLRDWLSWRAGQEQEPFDPSTGGPFAPGGIGGRIGKVSGKVLGGAKTQDVLANVEAAFPSLLQGFREMPQTLNVKSVPTNSFVGWMDVAPKSGDMTVNVSGRSPMAFPVLLHELLHARARVKPPSEPVLRAAPRSLTPLDKQMRPEITGEFPTPHALEEAYIRALSNRLLGRIGLGDLAEQLAQEYAAGPGRVTR